MPVIAVTEEFDHPQGQYRNLDTDNVLLLDELQARKHVDLRSFYSDGIDVPLFMYSLAQSMQALNLLDMAELEGDQAFRVAEQWTLGSTGPDPARGRKNTLRWTLASGANVTESQAEGVDLTGFDDADELVVTFAQFPGAALTLANCKLELEDAQGNSVALSMVNATASNGPQGIAEAVVGHIRILGSTWTATKHDMDTITERLVSIFARNGTNPTDYFPKLWRSTEPSGVDDPLPLNSRLAANFYTGNLSAQNRITLFLRGRREDFLTQLDLDGTDSLDVDGTPLYGESQATLRARGHQPDYGTAVYNPRDQMDLDVHTQTALNEKLQVELERVSDTVSASWIEVNLYFGVQNKVVIGTTETLNDEDRFEFPITGLTAQTQYLFTCDLDDHSLRCFIYPLAIEGAIDLEHPVFDSTALINEFLLKRRKGRIGWEIDLADGDAWVDSVRSRGLNFGEIITNNFESFTPVEGARIFVGGTPDIRVPTLVVPYLDATITVDKYNAQSTDGSFKVQSRPMCGIQTNFNVFEDFEHTSISFDLYYPSLALRQDQFLIAALINQRGYMIPLVLPGITGDQWQTMTIRPTQAIKEQSGSYRFVLMQSSGEQTWWIDNLNIVQRSIAWAGRASYNDPWNRENNRWTDFLSLTNSEVHGVMFPERGVWTQIRGRALVQNASIEKVYTKPKYAELGRMVWNSE